MLFLLLTIGPAFLFACGNILEKSGVSTVGKRTGGTSNPWEFFKGIVTNKFWWLGIACSGLATLGYYIAMAQYDLSQVQPMMVLNPVLTALMGFCILKEVLTKRIVVAICFVLCNADCTPLGERPRNGGLAHHGSWLWTLGGFLQEPRDGF